MIYVFENPENSTSIVYDGSTLTADEKSRAIEVVELPTKDESLGLPVLKCRKSTGEIWWEYITSVEVTEIERLTAENNKLKADMENTISAVDFILMNFQPLI